MLYTNNNFCKGIKDCWYCENKLGEQFMCRFCQQKYNYHHKLTPHSLTTILEPNPVRL